jgi:hypothetical protein
MKVCARRFNTYLALAMVLALFCGCQTEKQKEKKKEKKEVSALRIHLQTNPGPEGSTQTVSVLRTDPVSVSIGHNPVLTEANVIVARMIDTPGGFAVEVKFDESATLMLEQYSASNPGRHFVIFGQWGEKLEDGRWLAAPLITHRLSNGVLSFTPDMTREQADRFVFGLNNVAKQTQAGAFNK